MSPPTTVSASGWFASVPRSSPVAVGTSPMIVARLVIAIGMNRMRAASTTVDANRREFSALRGFKSRPLRSVGK